MMIFQVEGPEDDGFARELIQHLLLWCVPIGFGMMAMCSGIQAMSEPPQTGHRGGLSIPKDVKPALRPKPNSVRLRPE